MKAMKQLQWASDLAPALFCYDGAQTMRGDGSGLLKQSQGPVPGLLSEYRGIKETYNPFHRRTSISAYHGGLAGAASIS